MEVLFAAGFEIGLIPTTTFQPKSGRAHLLFELGRMAFGAINQGRIADLLQRLKFVATFLALVLVNRHGVQSTIYQSLGEKF